MLRKSLWVLAFLLIQLFSLFSYGEENRLIKKEKIEKIKKKDKVVQKVQERRRVRRVRRKRVRRRRRKKILYIYWSYGYSYTETQRPTNKEMTVSKSIPLGLYWYFGRLQFASTISLSVGEVFYIPAQQGGYSQDMMAQENLFALGDLRLALGYTVYKNPLATVELKFSTKIPTDVNSGTKKIDYKIESKFGYYLKKTKKHSIRFSGAFGRNHLSVTGTNQERTPVLTYTSGFTFKGQRKNTFGLSYYYQGSAIPTTQGYKSLILSYTGQDKNKKYTTVYTSFGLNRDSSRLSIGISRMGIF